MKKLIAVLLVGLFTFSAASFAKEGAMDKKVDCAAVVNALRKKQEEAKTAQAESGKDSTVKTAE